MKILRWLALLFVIVAVLFIARPDDSITRSFVSSAAQSVASTDYQRAADYLHLAATRQPWNTAFMLQAAEVAIQRQHYDEARAQLAQAEQAGADPLAVASLRADLAEKQNQFDEAARQWQAIIALRPADTTAYPHLINAFLQTDHWSAAQQAAGQWLIAAPQSGDARWVMAKLLALDDADQAGSYFRQVPADAARDFLAALAEPDRALRALLLGRAYLAQNDVPLAQRAFDAAIAANANYAEAYAYAGFVRDQRGLDGQTQLDRAVELDQDLVVARYFRARHAWQHGDLDRALADLKYAIERDPQNALIAVELGRVYEQRSELPSAEQWLIKARDLKPADPTMWTALAELYVGRAYGTPLQQVSTAQQLVQLAPDQAEAHIWLGRAYLLNGDRDAAQRELERAVQLNPQLASAHFCLGRLFGRDSEIGRAEYQRALALDPAGTVGTAAQRALNMP